MLHNSEVGKNRSHSLLPARRKWNKVIEPLTKYSRTDNGLDFSLDFFYHLQKMVEKGQSIRLNIPHTLTGTHDNFLESVFSKQNYTIGEVKLTLGYSKARFEQQVEKAMKQSLQKVKALGIDQYLFHEQQEANASKSFMLPFVVMKQKNAEKEPNTGKNVYQNLSLIWSSYEYRKINSVDVSQIVQSYIFTRSMVASVTRYFYNNSNKKGEAYKIDNYENILDQKRGKHHWKVQQQSQHTCSYVKVMPQNKSFHEQTLNLISYIEKYFKKQVQSMTTDWIIDTTSRYYLIDIKEVQLIEPKPQRYVHKSLSELLEIVSCCMCLQTCNQAEISKILTNKLIIHFCEHLKKRGVELSFRINFKKITNFSRVCNLCYSLVVAEAKLMDLQRKIDQIFNCSTEENYKHMKKYEASKNTRPNSMQSWRLFFYLQEFKNVSSILKDYQGSSVYLRFQIQEWTTYFQIELKDCNLNAKIIKIVHLLSQNENITEFLRTIEIRVQLLAKMKAQNPIAEGCIRDIYAETTQFVDHLRSQRKYKQILLFNEDSQYCILGMYIGVYNDGINQTIQIQPTKTKGIFKPNLQKIQIRALPAEWMEIIEPSFCDKTWQQQEQGERSNLLQSKQQHNQSSPRLKRVQSKRSNESLNNKSALPRITSSAMGAERRPRLVL